MQQIRHPHSVSRSANRAVYGLNPIFVYVLAGRDGRPGSLHIRGPQRELQWLCAI